MNLFHLLDRIESLDLTLTNQVNNRRGAFKNISKIASGVAMATIPLLVRPMKAAAQTPSAAVTDALNLLLVMKYLVLSFYSKGIDSPNLIPANHLGSIKQVQTDESHHISFLKGLIGPQAQTQPTFDFNPGGTQYSPFSRAFVDFVDFVNIGFTFEDLGNRLLQGVIAELSGETDLQRDLMNMHSVEARHSAHFRYLFTQVRAGGAESIWVQDPYNSFTNYSFVVPIYVDEENHIQLGIIQAGSGAFDEPMKTVEAKKILNTFIVSPKYVI